MSNTTNLIQFYHRIPHVYKNFTKLSKQHYSLKNQVYIESLGIIGTLPAIILIVILVNLLIYLLSFSCCFKKRLSRVNYLVNKVLLFLACLACCTTIGFSLYYNDELNNSVNKLTNYVRLYEGNLALISNSTFESQSIINNNIQLNLNNIERNYHEQQENTTDAHNILKYIQIINYNLTFNYELMNDINSNLFITNYSELVAKVEDWRWLIVLVFYIVFILICLLLVYGLLKNSRCSFISFSVLGLIVLIVNWCVVSGWLVLAVGTSDTCLESKTNNTLLHEFINIVEIKGSVGKIQQGLNEIRDVTKELRSLINFNYNFNYIEINIINLFEYYSTVELLMNNIATYTVTITTNYNLFKFYLCSQTLYFVHYLFLLNVGASFLLSLLIYMDSYIWIYLIQQRGGGPLDHSTDDDLTKYGHGHHGGHGQMVQSDEPSTLRQSDKMMGGGSGGRNSRGTCNPARSQPISSGRGRSGRSHSGGSSTLDHRHHSTFPRHQNGKYKTLNSNCKLLEASDYY